MDEILSNVDPPRKLLVSAKYWNGEYERERQKYGYRTYDHIGDVLFTNPWSPIVFRDGVRLSENFISSDWLVLDYDRHQLDIDQACKIFIDYRYIISTTKSHQPDSHCFRVCIPWERRITDPHEYDYNLCKAARQYESDLHALYTSRFFWPSKTLYRTNLDGSDMEVANAPPKILDDFSFIEMNRPSDPEIPERFFRLQRTGVDAGSRNALLWGISKDLYREGFEWHDVRKLIERIPVRPPINDYDRIVKSAQRSIEKERRKARKNTTGTD